MWLSYDDVLEVRNKLIGLYLMPGQFVAINGVQIYQFVAINGVQIYPGVNTKFVIPDDAEPTGWLKFKDGMPYFETDDDDYCDMTRYMIETIRSLHDYFPFKPTNNFIIHDETKAAHV